MGFAPLQGLGTRDNTLIRIMVSRSEIDMLDIREVFRTKYEKSLYNMIKVSAAGPCSHSKSCSCCLPHDASEAGRAGLGVHL